MPLGGKDWGRMVAFWGTGEILVASAGGPFPTPLQAATMPLLSAS